MGWLADERKEQSRVATEREFYVAAYEADLYAIWRGSPWEKEIPQLAQARAYTAMMNREEHYVRDARKLLYNYLDGEFGSSEVNDVLNLNRRQLDVKFPFRGILDTTFTHYDEPPTRTVGSDALTRRVSELYDTGRVDAMLSESERSAGFMPTLAIRPVWRGKRQDLDVYTPDVYRVRTNEDDPYTATDIAYPRRENVEGKETIVLKHWTPETITTRIAGEWGRVVSRIANPYGRLPFAFWRMRRGTTFYGQGDWDLVEATMQIHRIAFLCGLDLGTSFGMWVALNFGITETNPLKIGPGRLLTKENVSMNTAGGNEPTPEIENVAAMGQYRDMNELREELLRETKKARHLPSSEIDDTNGAPESGFARYLANLPLIKQKSRHRSALVEFERDLAPVMMLVATVDSGGEYEFTPEEMEASVSVDYSDEGIIMEPADEQTYDRERMKEGLMSALDYVRKWGQIDQRLTEIAASKLIAKNKELYTKIFGDTDGLSSGGEPTGGSEPGGDEPDGLREDNPEPDAEDRGSRGGDDDGSAEAEGV